MAVQLYDATNALTCSLPERFERKYYLSPWGFGQAYGLLRQICLPARQYPSERINSLYFDTVDLDQHARSDSGDYCKDKVRIRWYGEDEDLSGMQTVFLELKSRRGFASTKQRLMLQTAAESLTASNLGRGILPRTLVMDTLAKFGFFPPSMLFPVVKISYWRYRFDEITTEQRISLDCHIRSTMILLEPGNGEKNLELPGSVLEIKGQAAELPFALCHARMLDTDWTRFSKYSACIDAHTEMPGTVGRMSPSGRIVEL